MERQNVLMMEFTVRNDKYRGILLEKFATGDNEYFFKNHDQPVYRHCEQMQKIVLAADVKRTKTIRVDVMKFACEYFRNDTPAFKGCPMNSSNQQITNFCDLYINKEIGNKKRSATVAQNKTRKILEYNSKIEMKMQAAEKYFQEQRKIRMNEVFGPKATGAPPGPRGPQAPGTPQLAQRSGAQSQSSPQVPVPPQENDFPMDEDLSDGEF